MVATLIAFALFAGWVILNTKTSRPDGDPIRGLHPYRRLMAYIMVDRNESIVLFDSHADADELLQYINRVGEKFDVDIAHCLVGAALIGLAENPKMNRFSSGRRLYQRRGRAVTFSMKRKQLDAEAKLATVKMDAVPGETFRELCGRINAKVSVERSGAKTYADKEFDLLSVVPRPLLRFAVRLLKTLDYYNVLPASFIANDGLYTSMFIANLGSVGMGAGFHHLYEWGNCPLFMMAGKVEERPVVRDGAVVVRKQLHIRWSYDERIDDGLNARFGIDSVVRALEHPYEFFGCLADDGSDARPLDRNAPA
ncbi:MAG: hypothetical protein E4H03_08410 [Myxococcales bacterium]|jgi:hypothetical protein|nr:MAG: hypothetical protein E4H03_08410 [Myxococcales bacterium]